MAKKRVVEFIFDPFERVQPKAGKRTQAKDEIKEFLLEKIQSDAGAQRSSVTGQKWKGLSKEYAKIKGSSVADLVLTGAMFNGLNIVSSGTGLKAKVTGAKNAQKADGHNNHSGDSNLPTRKFIPDGSAKEDWRAAINTEIDAIIRRVNNE